MKFLSKTADSVILKENLTYRENAASNNQRIRELLLSEQKNFCAYTEKYIQHLDSTEVEHFDSSKKYQDDYYNYYTVIRAANLYKKDEQYRDATFFATLFFQNSEDFVDRIQYTSDGLYEEVKEEDEEAIQLIDFLGFNNHKLYSDRSKHINRIKGIFTDANFNNQQKIAFFRKHPEELSFITALEIELQLDLSEFYQ